jgi:phosphatidylglycerophosphate synthase
MLDAMMRRIIDPPLDRIGSRFAAAGVSANAITAGGFGIGLLAVPALAAEWYGVALILILLNRLADGIDGAVARHSKLTDLGGYLDIVCDFMFYAAIPFGFALARWDNAIAAAFLLLSFVGTGTSFLGYAIMAAKRQMTTDRRGSKSLYYLGGLTEGTETIAVFVAVCLMPDLFVPLAYAFGGLCWITTASRAITAWRTLRD